MLVNLDPTTPRNLTVVFGTLPGGGNGDLFPAVIPTARVRDLFARRDIGVLSHEFTATVPPHDAVMVRIYPQ